MCSPTNVARSANAWPLRIMPIKSVFLPEIVSAKNVPNCRQISNLCPIFAKDWRENAVDFSKPYQGHLLCMHGCGRRMHLRNTSATLNTWQMEICHVLPQGRLKLSDGDRSGKRAFSKRAQCTKYFYHEFSESHFSPAILPPHAES